MTRRKKKALQRPPEQADDTDGSLAESGPLGPVSHTPGEEEGAEDHHVTAPGGDAGDAITDMARQSLHLKREQYQELVSELKRLRRSESVVALNPDEVRAGDVNRVELAFDLSDSDFASLVQDIAARGGNTEPVRVRHAPRYTDDPAPWELISGHRRHEACRRNSLNVRALIVEIDDAMMRLDRLRENIHRQELSGYELALQYRELLRSDVARNASEIAAMLNQNRSTISRNLRLLKLPDPFWSLFSDPRVVPPKAALRVLDTWADDLTGLASYAEQLRATWPPAKDERAARTMLRWLSERDANRESPARGSSKSAAHTVDDEHGRTLFTVRPGTERVVVDFPAEAWSETLEALLRKHLASGGQNGLESNDRNENEEEEEGA